MKIIDFIYNKKIVMPIRDVKKETKEKYQTFGVKGITKRFKMACLSGDLHIIKYLLTSSDLKECVDIHIHDDFALRMACKRGHFDVMKYLLTSDELKEHANISVLNKIVLKQASENGHFNVVEYLLTETSLKENLETNILEFAFKKALENKNVDVVNYLLHFKLQNELPQKNEIKKMKI